ncbi:MAG: UshA-like (seleno)protein [Thermodesulfobacteriota bacterium]
MGGLPKRATLLQENPGENRLLIDGGDLLFTAEKVSNPTRLAQEKITAQAIISAYNILGYEAVAVGRRDLTGGLPFLNELAKAAKFPFLSANLVDRGGKTIFPASTIINRAGLKVAIMALTSPSAPPRPGYQINKWQESLPPLVAKLKRKSDILILLSNLKPTINQEIARQHQEIHLIIQSGQGSGKMAPRLVNNSLLSQSGKEGKYIGELKIRWSDSGRWQKKGESLLAKRQEMDRLNWQIKRLERRGDPAQVYKDAPQTYSHYKRLKGQVAELKGEITRLSSKKKQKKNPPATYTARQMAISSSLRDEPEIRQLLERHKRLAGQIKPARGQKNQQQGQGLKKYLGSRGCKPCHSEIFTAWQETAHARAMASLTRKGQEKNMKCVHCHVTGLEAETAQLAQSLPADLRQVGCEACHGPGRSHGLAPDKVKMAGTVKESRCLQCHSAEHDDDFNFQRDSQLIH